MSDTLPAHSSEGAISQNSESTENHEGNCATIKEDAVEHVKNESSLQVNADQGVAENYGDRKKDETEPLERGIPEHEHKKAKHSTQKQLRLIVIGKSGMGKSSLCNQIISYANKEIERSGGESSKSGKAEGSKCGRSATMFAVGQGLQPITAKSQQLGVMIHGCPIVVVDTPQKEDKTFIKEQHKATEKCKVVIIVCVRCDARYSAEEHSVYLQWQKLWGHDDDFRRRLIVAFTYGDKLHVDEGGENKTDESERKEDSTERDMTPEEKHLKAKFGKSWPELQLLMEKADDRFVLFNKKDDKPVERLLKLIEVKISQSPISGEKCPVS